MSRDGKACSSGEMVELQLQESKLRSEIMGGLIKLVRRWDETGKEGGGG